MLAADAETCGCTADVPCLEHVAEVSERMLNSPEALAADLASIPSDIDMAGPSEPIRAAALNSAEVWRNSRTIVLERENWQPATRQECNDLVAGLPHLSRAQREKISHLLWEIYQHGSYSTGNYEYKSAEVYVHTADRRPIAWVYTTMGRVGDEGTMAEYYARCRRHISVGWLRGGCELHNHARYDKRKKAKIPAANARGFWPCIYGTTT